MKTTMKKVLSMALALVLVLGMLPMAALATREVATGAPACFTANEGATHTHDSSKCENPEAHKDIGVSCIDANSSGYCDSCYGAVSAPHTCVFDSAWQTNGTQHWKVCGCGATQTPQNHTDADGLSHNAEKHWNTCSVCSAEYNVANHSGGTATCIAGKECDICKFVYTSPAANSHVAANNGAYEYDTEAHWQVCNLGGTAHAFGNAYHDMQPAGCNGGEYCKVCGYAPTDAAASHTWNVTAATCTVGQVCTKCGAAGEAIKPHTWVPATCLTAKTCNVCGTTEGSALGHNWNTNGTCTRCTTTSSSVTNYTITFDPNYDITPGTTVTVPYGTKLYNIYTPTRVGHTFQGWYYDKGFGSAVPTDAIATESRTLYAKWKPNAPYPVSVVVYGNGNTTTPIVTLDLYSWALDGEITLTDLKQAVAGAGIKANNNYGLTVYGPYTPDQWVSYMGNAYYKNITEKVQIKTNEPTVLYSMVQNVKVTKGTTDPYGAIADKTNPKTGDMIYAPMMVLGLSASALAVLYYLNKKRAF